jgi:hypothetical protein
MISVSVHQNRSEQIPFYQSLSPFTIRRRREREMRGPQQVERPVVVALLSPRAAVLAALAAEATTLAAAKAQAASVLEFKVDV